MIDLDIVIVNWNTGILLKECLSSIASAIQTGEIMVHCVVVDNASSDGSADDFSAYPFPLKVIRNDHNKGFAAACNQGARVGRAEYILFLNPDCRLFQDSLVKPLREMEKDRNSNVGILGIQLVDEQGVIQRNAARFPTPGSLFFQMVGLDRICPKRYPPHFMLEWDHKENRSVDQVTGAFTLSRRKLFEALNGFDERFFMYFEDLDLALRAKQAGWMTYFYAESRAVHLGGGASSKVKSDRLVYLFNSKILYVAKHFGISAAREILLATLMVEFWARIGWNIIHFSLGDAGQTILAYLKFLKYLPRLNSKIRNMNPCVSLP